MECLWNKGGKVIFTFWKIILDNGRESANVCLSPRCDAQPPHNMNATIEITKEAALLLIGNDEKTWADYRNYAVCEKTTYLAHGLTISLVHTFETGETKYYVQDIKA